MDFFLFKTMVVVAVVACQFYFVWIDFIVMMVIVVVVVVVVVLNDGVSGERWEG